MVEMRLVTVLMDYLSVLINLFGNMKNKKHTKNKKNTKTMKHRKNFKYKKK